MVLLSFGSWAKDLPSVEELLTEVRTVNWDTAISSSIVINAPVTDVWKYASDSNNAKDWSVFFDHISPLPGITDGTVGSLRRCFRNANEEGKRWDEVVIEIVPEQRRIITTYNLKGFDLNLLRNGDHVFVRQLYRAIDRNTTELTFQTQYSSQTRLRTRFSFGVSKKRTKKIFIENLENIKAMIEGYPRVHFWY